MSRLILRYRDLLKGDFEVRKSPSTAEVAAAFSVLKPLGVSRWDTENALKAAIYATIPNKEASK